MPEKTRGGNLFIVDNSDSEWKVRDYLREWSELAYQFDIATGSFEIGGLLALDSHWQKLDKIRVLIGDETTMRTRKAFEQAVQRARDILDASLEREKEGNDFLQGVPAIVEALANGAIECRVYRKDKFHAKAYITHSKLAVVGPAALVGSSNFTHPGLTQNVELNVQIQREVDLLQKWFETHWAEAEEVTPELLKVIERHTREYSPFDVYAKALQEYLRGHEMTSTEWEQNESRIYPLLDQYQKEGYHALLKIARQHNGAFLCDGVGLGKTFVGMMLLERLTQYDRKRVALFVPKAARKPVWESKLNRFLPHLHGDFSNLVIYNHTDLSRGGSYRERLARIKEMADVFIIDEGHHFRNPGIKGEGCRRPSRYRVMYDLAENKQVFLLTATPVNNSLRDLQHMIELFSRKQSDYFRPTLGINSLPGHFRKMEAALDRRMAAITVNSESAAGVDVAQTEADDVLQEDTLFKNLVVQRSRSYVRESQLQHNGTKAIFPTREQPKVAEYSVKKTYGRLLDMVEKAFSKDKPLFSLPIYYPLAYYKGQDGTIDPLQENRQKQVVGLVRIQFLKRFESSATAFHASCATLLWKLLAFVEKNSASDHEKSRLERWKRQHADLLGYVHDQQMELFGEVEEDGEEDLIPEELLEAAEELDRDEYAVEDILAETFLDLDQLLEFLTELQKFKPAHDDKLKALLKLLKTDPVLNKHKVLIFTEYQATANYLRRQLEEAGLTHIDEVDSTTKRDRGDILRQFAPYYNDSSSAQLAEQGLEETRILIATDVLSEGLNLQDATRLINYDLHWNPVRLMQRIGRVDRRMDPETEQQILADHPDQQGIRGTIAYWNFLPPGDLDRLLKLYTLVSHKVLRISKTFGIEGRQLLTPDDDFDSLREFIHKYEGTTTTDEKLHLEYQQLLKDNPGLEAGLNALPLRVFSGKEHPSKGAQAVFFCYALPAVDTELLEQAEEPDARVWTEEAGQTAWYLYDLAKEQIHNETAEIVGFIRSTPGTPRQHIIEEKTLSDIRKQVEKHIKNTYFKSLQAPVGVQARLKAWMELS